MKKKNAIIIFSVVFAVLLAGIAASAISKRMAGKQNGNESDGAATESESAEAKENAEEETGSISEKTDMDGNDSEISAPGDTEDSAKSDDPAENGAKDRDADESGHEKGISGNPISGGSGGSGGNGQEDTAASENSNTSQQSTEESSHQEQSSDTGSSEIPTISFPYSIPETNLVIQQISSYNGYYIEDASDKEVSGIAAIALTNKGGDLAFAGIGISQGTRSLAFSASQIPAGATVIIQEQSGAAFSTDPYFSATATTQPVDHFEKSEGLVKVEENGTNAITVTNISDTPLSEVKVFFKNYIPDEDVYVGGITYSFTLTNLQPGEATEVSASHYDSQYSRIIEITSKK